MAGDWIDGMRSLLEAPSPAVLAPTTDGSRRYQAAARELGPARHLPLDALQLAARRIEQLS